MPEKSNHPKPQVHELHVIFDNKLCTDGDDRLDRILHSLHSLLLKTDVIMGKQTEAASQLAAIGTQLGKAKAEILTKMQELQDAAANADNVSPELQTAIDNLVPAVQALDDIVADAPTEPPVEPTV